MTKSKFQINVNPVRNNVYVGLNIWRKSRSLTLSATHISTKISNGVKTQMIKTLRLGLRGAHFIRTTLSPVSVVRSKAVCFSPHLDCSGFYR